MTRLENGARSPAFGAQAGLPWTEVREPLSLNEHLQEGFCCGEELEPFLTETGCHARFCKHCKKSYFDNEQIHDAHSAWIGVDLDGTLAADTGRELWDTEGNPKIGRPIDEMVLRVKRWLAEGLTVKIFTARASYPSQVEGIRAWLARRSLPDLEITNRKDLNMVMLWDDRCVQVAPNSGLAADSRHYQ